MHFHCISQPSVTLLQATSYLNKLPKSFTAEDHILVADPMLATGMALTCRLVALPAGEVSYQNGLVTPCLLSGIFGAADATLLVYPRNICAQVANDVTVAHIS